MSVLVRFSAGDTPGTVRSAPIPIREDVSAEDVEPIDIQAFTSDPRATVSFENDTAVVIIIDGELANYKCSSYGITFFYGHIICSVVMYIYTMPCIMHW